MPGSWTRERALIVVRTYPNPARKGVEVSCTAAIKSGQWLRLFPVPYRFLDNDQRFKKYQEIEVDIQKSSDTRPESYKMNPDTIRIVSSPIPSDRNWQARKDVVFPLKSHCLCCLMSEQQANGFPTLGLFKPKIIEKFSMTRVSDQWTTEQLARLRQEDMFRRMPTKELEKIPYEFYYHFRCEEPKCKGHRLSCHDWEIGESYRRWSRQYGPDWEGKFLQRYESDMIGRNDTHFYVGTVRQHPRNWIIVGLFYPRLVVESEPTESLQLPLL